MKTKLKTKIFMKIAKCICRTIHILRCRSFLRRLDDFNYEVKDMRVQYPNEAIYKKAVGSLPFYKKQVLKDDEIERTVALKVGDCLINYSFDKLRKYLDVRDVPITEPEFNSNVAIALAKSTTKTHNVATVVNLNDRKGENEQLRKSSS
tara:strand:+ start:728 stop:1174 length:447 start_codon:yes stop_codon:yes gene_type:complete